MLQEVLHKIERMEALIKIEQDWKANRSVTELREIRKEILTLQKEVEPFESELNDIALEITLRNDTITFVHHADLQDGFQALLESWGYSINFKYEEQGYGHYEWDGRYGKHVAPTIADICFDLPSSSNSYHKPDTFILMTKPDDSFCSEQGWTLDFRIEDRDGQEIYIPLTLKGTYQSSQSLDNIQIHIVMIQEIPDIGFM